MANILEVQGLFWPYDAKRTMSPDELANAVSGTRVRHDISHFGGQRHDGNFQEFINRLAVLEQALGCLVSNTVKMTQGINIKVIQ